MRCDALCDTLWSHVILEASRITCDHRVSQSASHLTNHTPVMLPSKSLFDRRSHWMLCILAGTDVMVNHGTRNIASVKLALAQNSRMRSSAGLAAATTARACAVTHSGAHARRRTSTVRSETPFLSGPSRSRLAGGGWGLCCRCTSLVLLHPVWGIAGSLLSLFEFSIQMTGGRTRTSRTHARGRSPVHPRARRSGEAETGSDGWPL